MAQYIIRARISKERMVYVPSSEAAENVASVICQAKDCSSSKTFLALDDTVPHLIDTDIESKKFRISWSRLIQKIYSRDPLIRPKCSGKMKLIALIDDVDVIKKILQHFDLWETRNHDPPPGKIMLEYIPEKDLHIEQLIITCNLQYLDLDNKRYEDDYSRLPAEKLCSKLSASL